ncbi:6-phosphofructokinase [Marinobacterium mangrovicola]|uniref:ATP-dependent 6-phosphofructokinase n=1 Tax=Marinobacterium mangrovicola TaxID=1476959 RepID=A0A4R1GD76_9GAMM|nr:6-phosphofructokinase [Marinobacterium mangrovicola]TCK03709.1 6-phosphofructokinase [Marinobacterium mangrovicola]
MYTLPELKQEKSFDSIAIMTSGGDAPGMNPAIRGVVRAALSEGIKVYGIQRGYSGLIADDMSTLQSGSVSNIVQRGGTVLKTDRCIAFKDPAVRAAAAEILRRRGIGALVVIGGDGSLTGAHLLEEETGIPVIGIPGTIDNDIFGTEDTIGFDTAVNTALEAIDRIRDTATSHERHFLVEVMGRASGAIAINVGLAAGAEMILVPERAIDVAAISSELAASRRAGTGSSGIIVVAEGPTPGLTARLAEQLREQGQDPRVCILGHIQRGGSPSGHDRVLATCMGAMAIRYLCAGYSDIMVGVRDGSIIDVPLDDVIRFRKGLDPSLLDMALQVHR